VHERLALTSPLAQSDCALGFDALVEFVERFGSEILLETRVGVF
jgi:hypothetical protein